MGDELGQVHVNERRPGVGLPPRHGGRRRQTLVAPSRSRVDTRLPQLAGGVGQIDVRELLAAGSLAPPEGHCAPASADEMVHEDSDVVFRARGGSGQLVATHCGGNPRSVFVGGDERLPAIRGSVVDFGNGGFAHDPSIKLVTGHLVSYLFFELCNVVVVRADRLVAIVLLLQAHGQRTVTQLAGALEASERTIRRDLDALCAAGVPVYAQRGRGGGWALLGGHRIDLSGLTAAEASSLVLAASGAPGQKDVGAALRKVIAALPTAIREQVNAAQGHVHVDPTAWGQLRTTKPSPDGVEVILAAIREALERNVVVNLCYARPGSDASWRLVHPQGLVVKHGTWYLLGVGPAGSRTYRVSRIEALELTSETASTPPDFDLAATWRASQQSFEALRPCTQVTVELLVDDGVWARMSGRIGAWWDLIDLGACDDGRRSVLVSMTSAHQAALELVCYDATVEVRGPQEVREELATLGRRLVDRYQSMGTPSGTPSGTPQATPQATPQKPNRRGDNTFGHQLPIVR